MIKSMTAYGRGEARHDGILLVSEVRSVNGRYRDIIVRLPRDLQLALEKTLRDTIARRVQRGRVEANFQVDAEPGRQVLDLKLNEPLVQAYLKVFREMAVRFDVDRHISLETLCQIKDLVLLEPQEMDLEGIGKGLCRALEAALDSLDAMRRQEGRAIEADFQERLAVLEDYTEQIEHRAAGLAERYRTRLREQVKRLAGDTAVDESRLTQEIVLLAERADITEELVRIRSHLGQFRDYMAADEAVGRRLDFLLQEIHREVNTLGVKASDSATSGAVVEMKGELEKLREQVQNVE